MELRVEREADHNAVHELVLAAFGDGGAVVAGLLDALRALITPHDGVSLIAVDGRGVAGHAMLTPALLDAPPRLVNVQVLSPLAVRPDVQRRGVGRALVGAALQHADGQGVPLVFLEGDPAYYGRLGFERGGPKGFRKPSLRIPDAAFQVYPLAAYEPWMTGTLVYPSVFWDHDAVGLRD